MHFILRPRPAPGSASSRGRCQELAAAAAGQLCLAASWLTSCHSPGAAPGGRAPWPGSRPLIAIHHHLIRQLADAPARGCVISYGLDRRPAPPLLNDPDAGHARSMGSGAGNRHLFFFQLSASGPAHLPFHLSWPNLRLSSYLPTARPPHVPIGTEYISFSLDAQLLRPALARHFHLYLLFHLLLLRLFFFFSLFFSLFLLLFFVSRLSLSPPPLRLRIASSPRRPGACSKSSTEKSSSTQPLLSLRLPLGRPPPLAFFPPLVQSFAHLSIFPDFQAPHGLTVSWRRPAPIIGPRPRHPRPRLAAKRPRCSHSLLLLRRRRRPPGLPRRNPALASPRMLQPAPPPPPRPRRFRPPFCSLASPSSSTCLRLGILGSSPFDFAPSCPLSGGVSRLPSSCSYICFPVRNVCSWCDQVDPCRPQFATLAPTPIITAATNMKSRTLDPLP